MPKNDLSTIDLNLLVHLRYLLEEENVGTAAKRARLSSSAMSRKLASLRLLFGDPLLVTHGRGLVRTPHATLMMPRIDALLADIQSQFMTAPSFEPATASDTWTMAASDSTHLLLAGPLLQRIRPQAPNLKIRFVGPEVLFRGGLARGEVEFGLGPRSDDGSTLRARTLLRQRFLTLARADHAGLEADGDGWTISLDAFCAADHGLVSPRGRPGSFIDDGLVAVGRSRDVVAIAQSFAVAAGMVVDGDLLVTLPALLAKMLAGTYSRPGTLVTVVPPVEVPETLTVLHWHPRHQEDLGHIWIRKQFVAAADDVASALGH